MSDRLLTLFSLLLLAAVIAVMSWRDLHPAPRQPDATANAVTGYYAGADALAAQVPDDSRPLTIAQGTFGHGGAFIPHGMSPTTFAQRQVNLLLRFDALPKNQGDAFARIQSLIKDWSRQGTSVSMIFLDYRPRNPDFKAYAAFLEGLQKSFGPNPHVLVAAAELSWAESPEGQAGLRLLADHAAAFLLALDKPAPPEDTLRKLGSFGYAFRLLLPPDAPPGAIDGAALQKTDFFGGALLTLGKTPPPLKKEPKVGVFPRL